MWVPFCRFQLFTNKLSLTQQQQMWYVNAMPESKGIVLRTSREPLMLETIERTQTHDTRANTPCRF
jgi:hypothetical protein